MNECGWEKLRCGKKETSLVAQRDDTNPNN